MTFGTAVFANEPFAKLDPIDATTGAFQELIDFGVRTPIVLVEINMVEREAPNPDVASRAIGQHAIGLPPGVSDLTSPDSISRIYGDGWFITTPTDTKRPNLICEARVLQALDLADAKPVVPEATARARQSLTQVRLQAGDGELDTFLENYSADGQTVTTYLAPALEDTRNWVKIAEATATGWAMNNTELSINVTGPASRLDRQLQSDRFRGTGGLEGPASLQGHRKPLAFGQCFNCQGVLVIEDEELFRLHNGRIFGVGAARHRGLALTWFGDFPNVAALRLAEIPAGYYATCLATGWARTNIADVQADPEAEIRFDILGDYSGFEYVNQAGTILLRLAEQYASIDPAEINRPFFFALQDGIVGHFERGGAGDGKTIAEIFDEILRPYNGSYGAGIDSRLIVADLSSADNLGTTRTLVESDILSIQTVAPPFQPRFKMTYLYRRNWSPHTEDELAGSLTQEEVELYTQDGTEVSKTEDILETHPNAVEVPTIATGYQEFEPARQRLESVLQSVSGDELFIQVKLGRIGFGIKDTSILEVDHPRYGLSGKKFRIIGRRFDMRELTVTLSLRAG